MTCLCIIHTECCKKQFFCTIEVRWMSGVCRVDRSIHVGNCYFCKSIAAENQIVISFNNWSACIVKMGNWNFSSLNALLIRKSRSSRWLAIGNVFKLLTRENDWPLAWTWVQTRIVILASIVSRNMLQEKFQSNYINHAGRKTME